MNHASKLLKYEIHNLIRSRWLLSLGVLLVAVSELLFRFGGDPAKTVTSLMNIVLMIIPLMSLALGTIYFYNSREFNELLLAQPINRPSIYLGKLIGFIGALCIVFVLSIVLPFLIHSIALSLYVKKVLALVFVGCALIVIFASTAFLAATRFEDKIKGVGSMLILWFSMTVIYDGLLLLFLHIFRSYPYESALTALVMLNPIDLGRILILLQLEISSLMGYTGAVFRDVFGSRGGVGIAAALLAVYAAVPIALGLFAFRKKDF